MPPGTTLERVVREVNGSADGTYMQPHGEGRRNEVSGEGCEMLQRTTGVEGMRQMVEGRSKGGARAWASYARIPFTARRELQL
jgi:hypothetical protein